MRPLLTASDTEFNFITRLDFSSAEVMKEGVLTPPVIAQLQTWLPALAAREDKTNVTPQELFSLITVESICLVASRRIDARETKTQPDLTAPGEGA